MPKIIVLPFKKDGCGWYRIYQPYVEMHRQGLADVSTPRPDDLENEDYVQNFAEADYIVCRFCHARVVNDFVDKYFPGKKIILDNDDYVFEPDPYTELYRFYGTREVKHEGDYLWKDGQDRFDIRRNIATIIRDKKLIDRADILTVSTPRLKKVYGHRNTLVVYNGLDLDIWKPHQIKKTEMRIGWAGGSTHYSDLYTVKKDLEYLSKKYNFKLVITGSLFDGLFKNIKNKEMQEWIDISGHPYRTILNNLDLAFIPLADNTFNSYKSCIKWYEFASVGTPCLAVNLPPYSDEMPSYALYDNFRERAEEYIGNHKLREQNAEESREWVSKNRNIKNIVKDLASHL